MTLEAPWKAPIQQLGCLMVVQEPAPPSPHVAPRSRCDAPRIAAMNRSSTGAHYACGRLRRANAGGAATAAKNILPNTTAEAGNIRAASDRIGNMLAMALIPFWTAKVCAWRQWWPINSGVMVGCVIVAPGPSFIRKSILSGYGIKILVYWPNDRTYCSARSIHHAPVPLAEKEQRCALALSPRLPLPC